jgi:hypothetical protein
MLPIDPVLIALGAEQGLLPESRVAVAPAATAVCTEDEGSHEPINL